MRPLVLSSLFAAVAVGGVALAQPLFVVDPWAKPHERTEANTWFAPEPPRERAPSSPNDAELEPRAPLGDAALEAARTPRPVAPPAKQRATGAYEPDADELVVDPWARSERSEPVARAEAAPPPGAWTARVVEVIDPWQRDASVAGDTKLRLIVDPWAR